MILLCFVGQFLGRIKCKQSLLSFFTISFRLLCARMHVPSLDDKTASDGIITTPIEQTIFPPRLELQSIGVKFLNDLGGKADIMFRIKLDRKATAQHKLQGLLHFLELFACQVKIY